MPSTSTAQQTMKAAKIVSQRATPPPKPTGLKAWASYNGAKGGAAVPPGKRHSFTPATAKAASLKRWAPTGTGKPALSQTPQPGQEGMERVRALLRGKVGRGK